MAKTETLFATTIYRKPLGGAGATSLNQQLKREALALRADDGAGRAWSARHAYRGYTSYASLTDLTERSPTFADLARALDRHAAAFARLAQFDIPKGALKLNSLWVNVLDPGGMHAGHIHPLSVISGTYYVDTPKGAGALKFEDPRLGLMMHAPPRKASAPRSHQSFVTIAPAPGIVLLWESWLRHEVPPNQAKTPRISISFNYGWA
jgi:uncharacterized protein (TIGR02466 family)